MQRQMSRMIAVIGLLALCGGSYLAGTSHLLAPSRSLAADDCQTFTETGKTVCGVFLAYWKDHGGLAQQGFPISGEFGEVSATDGKTYTVQYFERAVFEKHPENQPPYNVLLTLLGSEKFKTKYFGKEPGGAPVASVVAPPPPPASAAPLPGSGMGVDILQKGCTTNSGNNFSYCGFIVRNTTTSTIRSVTLSYTIYARSGVLLASDNAYVGMLHPGERGGTADGKSVPKDSDPSRVEVQVVEVRPLAKGKELASLVAKDANFVRGDYSNKVVLSVVNPNGVPARDVAMYVVFFDSANTVVGAGYETYLDPVPANGQRSGEITSVSTLQYARYEVFAYLDYQSTTGDYS